MNSKKTLVLGASSNPNRYSFRAANSLINHQHQIILVGNKAGKVNEISILQSIPKNITIDTVTIYLGAKNQTEYYNDLIELKPRRIIFNPGAENPALERLALENEIEVENSCTLVLLSTEQY